MKLSDVVSHAGLAGYAEVALVLFAMAFVVMVFDTFNKRRAPLLAHQASLPLEDDNIVAKTDEGEL